MNVDHDDLCVWWDNVGKEPHDYACTCGKWAEAATALQAENERLQAKIDALMLEYCPDEMTPDQRAEYERNQQAISERAGAAIDAALASGDEKFPPSDQWDLP